MSLFRQRGDDRQQPGEYEKKQIEKNIKIGVCPIVFGELSLGVLCVDFIKGVTEKQDGSISIALLEALAGRFVCFGESDVNPRPIQARRIGGPGSGYGEG